MRAVIQKTAILDVLVRNLDSIWEGDVEDYRAPTAEHLSFPGSNPIMWFIDGL